MPFPFPTNRRAEAAALVSLIPEGVDRLLEPFVGSGAVTLEAARQGRAAYFVVGDEDKPLVAIWQLLIERPRVLTEGYAALVDAHGFDAAAVTSDWRYPSDPSRYLFAMSATEQVAPDDLTDALQAAHALLVGRAGTLHDDYSLLLRAAQPEDFVYLDPPTIDFDADRFRQCITEAEARGVRWMATTDVTVAAEERVVSGLRVVGRWS